jgi:hypothetical protein
MAKEWRNFSGLQGETPTRSPRHLLQVKSIAFPVNRIQMLKPSFMQRQAGATLFPDFVRQIQARFLGPIPRSGNSSAHFELTGTRFTSVGT